jgi:ribosomal protein L44E
MHLCLECGAEFAMYPVINGERIDLRGRKRCLECRPLRRLRRPRKKVARAISLKICESCCEAFPAKMLIGGKMRWLQRRRFCLRCSPFDAHNTSNSPPGDTTPTDLKEQRRRRRNAKTYRSLKKRRLRRKAELVAAAGGRCVDCGYSTCLAALEFHHRDATTKEFGVGNFSGSLERLRGEVAKCDLLCANCHRARHAREDADLVDMHPSAESRRRTKLRAVAWFGGSCYGCDEVHLAQLYEFHHWDAHDKDFGIASNGVARSWEKIVAELEKCVMLCANCHREVHAGVRTIRPTLVGLAEDALPYAA